METRLGHDFSQVRVHTGGHATASTEAVQARAYTVGQQIVFAPGQYAPGTSAGRWLLAHELAHTVQQERAGSGLQARLTIGAAHDPAEAEADRVADQVVDREIPGSFRILGDALCNRFAQRAEREGLFGPAEAEPTAGNCPLGSPSNLGDFADACNYAS